jgi:hypothetical protein
MNEIDLEKELHSWKPRKISAGLKRRTFAAKDQGPEARPAGQFAWLVPACAAFCVVFAALHPHNESFFGGATKSAFPSGIASNNYAPTLAPIAHSNRPASSLRAGTFDWTNGNSSTSSISSLSGSKGKSDE